MSHPLDDARLKIVRAGDHIETLSEDTRRFARHNRYSFRFDHDSESKSATITVRSHRIPPLPVPTDLSAIVGDILTNLRSGLNHLVWQLAIHDGGGATPAKTVQYPIFDTCEQFKNNRKAYLGRINAAHTARIRRLQPYHGSDEGRLLGVLAQLDNTNKHQIVHVGWGVVPTGEGSLRSPNVISAQVTSADWQRIEHGAVLYRITDIETRDGSDVTMQPPSTYTIVFGEELAVSGADFSQMRDVVHNIVESFAPEFD